MKNAAETIAAGLTNKTGIQSLTDLKTTVKKITNIRQQLLIALSSYCKNNQCDNTEASFLSYGTVKTRLTKAFQFNEKDMAYPSEIRMKVYTPMFTSLNEGFKQTVQDMKQMTSLVDQLKPNVQALNINPGELLSKLDTYIDEFHNKAFNTLDKSSTTVVKYFDLASKWFILYLPALWFTLFCLLYIQ
ncbi:hypothetical protein Ciccas_014502, partial [Cichlidogyrus casuarinus]